MPMEAVMFLASKGLDVPEKIFTNNYINLLKGETAVWQFHV